MWDLILGLIAVLGVFSALLLLLLRQFSTLTARVSREQAQSLASGLREISVIQSEALAKVIAPVFTPPPVPAQAQDLQEEKVPEWRETADSPDLIDETGRPMTWETPVLSEAESMGPGDLWAHPSQT